MFMVHELSENTSDKYVSILQYSAYTLLQIFYFFKVFDARF